MSAVFKNEINSVGDDTERFWQAVLSKDRQYDGQFVFAVSSTGIYCRPSCPARRARRDRVTFFALPEAAEEAGFRECRRCHPKNVSALDPRLELIRRACRLIEEQDEERVSLEALGKLLGVSSFHFQRTFKRVMGITPRQYAEACRARRFRSSVQSGESITSAMYEAGYGSSSRLYERAESELGMTPATYGRGGKAMKISYTVASSPMGQLLVAATDKGICAVRLGDTVADLESDLREEFAAADIRTNDEGLRGAVAQIVRHLEGKQPGIELPLDIRATAFQRLVWEALQAIPLGETRSYSEVAKGIGKPSAVRAVARACASNSVALVIPCHRVIREDQNLGGYRWGLERKKKLLASERERAGKGAG